MTKERLLAFSDGVIAILLTIMVLELVAPHGSTFRSLLPLLPKFLSYILSFIYIGIYWNNHHHLFQVVDKVNGKILWANLNLLFWLSLISFSTSWMGENNFTRDSVMFYGFILLMNGVSYTILVLSLIGLHGRSSVLSKAIGKDTKGKISVVMYITGIVSAWFNPWIGLAFFVAVACIWIIPDRRIEEKKGVK